MFFLLHICILEGFCERQGLFYYRHVRTDRWFWGLDVPVLQERGLLPVARFSAADAKREFKRASLRLHLDKGGDLAVWKDVQARFEAVFAEFAEIDESYDDDSDMIVWEPQAGWFCCVRRCDSNRHARSSA